ncbi:uncharacterized protein si:ch211-116o3.5 [Osmerus mordax]|uniref:uncharacterized protein si:ch211-116o3.5 n=1 Tax=Osmerus mordax TaxID=8014 RepID=UPI0035103979
MELREKKPNKWWTESDTFAMLNLIQQLDLVHELDKKRQRNYSHFRRLRSNLARRDIMFTVNQIRNRWKSLKHKYRKIKMAGYRSPAARLAAIESFRYFRLLDRMLARKPRTSGPDLETGSTEGHTGVERTPSDLEDPTDDGTGDYMPSWQSSMAPPLEGDSDNPRASPDECQASPGAPAWGLHPPEEAWGGPGQQSPSLGVPRWEEHGSDEVMTLGESGEYLYPVKTEPQTPPCLAGGELGSEHASFSPGMPAGTCEDSPSLVLQQLSMLNQQVALQRAEQRAFHCSLLGLLDRQTHLLEQLSNNTTQASKRCPDSYTHQSPSDSTHQSPSSPIKPDPDRNDSSSKQAFPSRQAITTSFLQNDPPNKQMDLLGQAEPMLQTDPSTMVLQVHSALVQILRGVEQVQTQRQQPCSCKTSPSQPPSLVPSPSQPSSQPTSPSKPPSETPAPPPPCKTSPSKPPS